MTHGLARFLLVPCVHENDHVKKKNDHLFKSLQIRLANDVKDTTTVNEHYANKGDSSRKKYTNKKYATTVYGQKTFATKMAKKTKKETRNTQDDVMLMHILLSSRQRKKDKASQRARSTKTSRVTPNPSGANLIYNVFSFFP